MPDVVLLRRNQGRRASDVRRESHTVQALVRDVLVVAGLVGAIWLIYELGTLILLLFFSVLFAYLVAPLVSFVRGRLAATRGGQSAPLGLAIAIVYLVLFGGLALWLTWITPHLSDAVRQLPDRIQSMEAKGNPFDAAQARFRIPGLSSRVIDQMFSTLTSVAESGARKLVDAVVGAASNLPWLILIPILGFFLLKDGRTLREQIVGMLPGAWRQRAPSVLARVDAALAAYIRAQLIACLIVGALVFVGFMLMKVPFAPVLAAAAGIAEFVPLVGPLVIAIASAVVAAFRSPMAIVWVLVFLGVLRVLQDYVIYPRLIGSSVHLHPLAVILAVLAGGELGGAVGVLVAIPLLAVASAVYTHLAGSALEQRSARASDDVPTRALGK
jgi:predicted PurR-regulated permease PerM